MMADIMDYRCLRCSKPLSSVEDSLRCGACGQSYTVVDGIPVFTEDRYWGKVPLAEMEEAVRVIDKEGWEAFRERFEKRLDVAFDESRADWRFEVPLTGEWTVLDTGAGLGRNTLPLARVAKKVVAFDQSLSRMRFLKRALGREKLGNVELFVGDIFDLPLPEKSFDLIAMNGVLEWVGKTDRFADAREAQLAALRICKKLLKPGGYLYIGIENRYSFIYMRGPDHEGLMYTTFMPRAVASWYNRLRRGEPYQTYTYSKAGYDRLLRDAGFSSTEFFLPYPGYNLPRIILPYADLRALSFTLFHLVSVRSVILRNLMRLPFVLRIYRYFFFSFNIITRV